MHFLSRDGKALSNACQPLPPPYLPPYLPPFPANTPPHFTFNRIVWNLKLKCDKIINGQPFHFQTTTTLYSIPTSGRETLNELTFRFSTASTRQGIPIPESTFWEGVIWLEPVITFDCSPFQERVMRKEERARGLCVPAHSHIQTKIKPISLKHAGENMESKHSVHALHGSSKQLL